MHPIFADKERLLLYMAAWLVIAGLLCLLFVTMNSLTWGESAALFAPMSFVYAFMSLAALYVCKAFPLQENPVLKITSVVIVASSLTASVWLILGKGIAVALSRVGFFPQLSTTFDINIPLLLGIGMLLFVLAIVVHYLLIAFDSARVAERKALEMQVVAREAELKALRAQIQPHFLFNSLNSISSLTATNTAAARTMTVQLADFFRKTLKLGQEQFIPLAAEFGLIENFLEIEKVRFGERLSFAKDLDERCGQILVPSLVLQPIVENAINHGIAHLLEGGTILISAKRNSTTLMLTVSNPCDPDRPNSKSTGVGLTNVRRRLEALYGNEASLEIMNDTHEYRVELSLPIIM